MKRMLTVTVKAVPLQTERRFCIPCALPHAVEQMVAISLEDRPVSIETVYACPRGKRTAEEVECLSTH